MEVMISIKFGHIRLQKASSIFQIQSVIIIFLNIILYRYFNSFLALLLFSLAFDYLDLFIRSDAREVSVLLSAEIVDTLLIIISLN